MATIVAPTWKLRVRFGAKSMVLENCGPDTSFGQLKGAVRDALSLPEGQDLIIRAGFPPKELLLTAGERLHPSISSNETLVISVRSAIEDTPKSLGPITKPNTAAASTDTGRTRERGPTGSSTERIGSRKRKRLELRDKEEVALKLLTALSGPAKDTASAFLRAATKSAVRKQYELTLANARFKAALAGDYTVAESDNVRRLGSGATGALKVKFKKTDRTYAEEEVQALSKPELRGVIQVVLKELDESSRDWLKPFKMAECSPRVFWSLVHHYGSVDKGLKSLVPEMDWSFLVDRRKTLSERAAEAKATQEMIKLQKEELKRERERRKLAREQKGLHSAQETNKEDSLQATSLVPAKAQIAEGLTEEEVEVSLPPGGENEERTTSAFTPKPGGNQGYHSEDDEAVAVICDSCGKTRILEKEDAKMANLSKDPWTCNELKVISRRSATTCDSPDDEVAQIAKAKAVILQDRLNVKTLEDLTLLPAIADAPSALSLAEIKDWVAEAQRRKLEQLMAEILGDSDVEEALNSAGIATPRDILMTPPDLIQKEVTHRKISISTVCGWREASQAAIESYPWLREWTWSG